MKTVASIADARKMALRHGAALEVEGGATFNAGRSRAAPPAPKPPARPQAAEPVKPAAPPPEPALSRAEVDAMLAARDQAWRAQIENMTLAFGQALQALKQPEPRGKVQQFNVTYDSIGRVDVVVPTYET